MALDALVNKYGNQVAAIAVYDAGGTPPFYNLTSLLKITRYHAPYLIEGKYYFGTPWLWCDGNKNPTWDTSTWDAYISQHLSVPPEMDVQIHGQYNPAGGTLDLQFQVKNMSAKPLTGRMYGVLTEDGISWAAPNGQKIHNRVPRIWWPDKMGRTVTLASGGTTTISATWSINKDWKVDNLKVVAFVQDTTLQPDFTLAVFQGASQKVTDIQSGILTDGGEVVRNFQLFQNTPNPFNPSTKILFQMPEQNLVLVSVFDAQGRKIGTLFEGVMPAGSHAIVWNGRDEKGQPMPSGVYILKLNAGRNVQSMKMTLMK